VPSALKASACRLPRWKTRRAEGAEAEAEAEAVVGAAAAASAASAAAHGQTQMGALMPGSARWPHARNPPHGESATHVTSSPRPDRNPQSCEVSERMQRLLPTAWTM